MASSSGSLDYWRKFFRSANSDIFDVLERAILVAASDYPQEFRNRRDRILEQLFTALLPLCSGCGGIVDEDEGDRSVKTDADKESKVGSSNFGPEDSNRLSDNVLFESLRRLQLMVLSVEVLKATEIGKAVNCLRRYNSKQIRNLVRTLIDGWKVLVDEWMIAATGIADNSPNSTEQPVEDEEGLPSPPLDEGALLATQTNSIQFSEFFDGIDDDSNFRNNGVLVKQEENGCKYSISDDVPSRKQPPLQKIIVRNERAETMWQEIPEGKQVTSKHEPRDSCISKEKRQTKQQELLRRQTKSHEPLNSQIKHESVMNKLQKPMIPSFGLGKLQNLPSEQNDGTEIKPKRHQNAEKATDKVKSADEASVKAKLEVAKRRLHEGYQQAEIAKRMRTIQVMELHDLPKRTQNRHPNLKPKNNIRSLVKGRR